MSVRRLTNLVASAKSTELLAATAQREFDNIYKNLQQIALSASDPVVVTGSQVSIKAASRTQAGALSAADYARFDDAVSAIYSSGNVTADERTKWNSAYTHSLDVSGGVHGATSSNTANMIVRRGASGEITVGETTVLGRLAVGEAPDYHNFKVASTQPTIALRVLPAGATQLIYGTPDNKFVIYNGGGASQTNVNGYDPGGEVTYLTVLSGSGWGASAGYVGIGKTPTEKLDINGNVLITKTTDPTLTLRGTPSGYGPRMYLDAQASGWAAFARGGGVTAFDASDGIFLFRANYTDQEMWIAPAYVTINNSLGTLNLYSSSWDKTGVITAYNGLYGGAMYLSHPAGVHVLGNLNLGVAVASDGDVGIGTEAPAAKLDVRGNITTTSTIHADSWIETAGTLWAVGGQFSGDVKVAGNLGIGKDPTCALDVIGVVKASGAVRGDYFNHDGPPSTTDTFGGHVFFLPYNYPATNAAYLQARDAIAGHEIGMVLRTQYNNGGAEGIREWYLNPNGTTQFPGRIFAGEGSANFGGSINESADGTVRFSIYSSAGGGGTFLTHSGGGSLWLSSSGSLITNLQTGSRFEVRNNGSWPPAIALDLDGAGIFHYDPTHEIAIVPMYQRIYINQTEYGAAAITQQDEDFGIHSNGAGHRVYVMANAGSFQVLQASTYRMLLSVENNTGNAYLGQTDSTPSNVRLTISGGIGSNLGAVVKMQETGVGASSVSLGTCNAIVGGDTGTHDNYLQTLGGNLRIGSDEDRLIRFATNGWNSVVAEFGSSSLNFFKNAAVMATDGTFSIVETNIAGTAQFVMYNHDYTMQGFIKLFDQWNLIQLGGGAGMNMTLRLDASDMVYFNSTGGSVYVENEQETRYADTVDLHRTTYTSQMAGWRISHLGEADFRYIYTDELHAKAFIADLEQALAGSQIICKSVAKLAVAVDEFSESIVVETFAGFPTFAVFQDGDVIRVRSFDRSGGQLLIEDAWAYVEHESDNATNPPTQTYKLWSTWPGVDQGWNAVQQDFVAGVGTLVLDYGIAGTNGFVESNAMDGLNGSNSPYTQTATFDAIGGTYTVKSRLGNLSGHTDADFGALSGFGLFTEQGYFKGNIVVKSGVSLALASSTIAIGKITGTAANAIKITNGTGDTATDGIFAYNGTSAVVFALRMNSTAQIAGWSFDSLKLFNGTDIVLDASGKKVSVAADAVQMYYTDPMHYGLKDSAGMFSLGYENFIAGWTFDTGKLYNGTDVVLSATGKKVSVAADAVKLYFTDATHYGIMDAAGKFSLGYENFIAGWSFTTTVLNKALLDFDGNGMTAELQLNAGIQQIVAKMYDPMAGVTGSYVSMGIDPITGTDYGLWAGKTDTDGNPDVAYFYFRVPSAGGAPSAKIAGWSFSDVVINSIYGNNIIEMYSQANGGNQTLRVYNSSSKVMVSMGVGYWSNNWQNEIGFALLENWANTPYVQFTKNMTTGTLTAKIAGWTFDSAKIYQTNAVLASAGYVSFGATPPTGYGNNVGAWLGYSSGAKMSLYSDANNYMQWDGSALSVGGATLTAGTVRTSGANTTRIELNGSANAMKFVHATAGADDIAVSLTTSGYLSFAVANMVNLKTTLGSGAAGFGIGDFSSQYPASAARLVLAQDHFELHRVNGAGSGYDYQWYAPTQYASPGYGFILAQKLTLGDNINDDTAAGIVLSPSYYAALSYGVTRHSYITLDNPALSGGAGVTDACVFRFTAAVGTHKAVDSGSTHPHPATTDAWIKININGTVYYMPAYTHKT